MILQKTNFDLKVEHPYNSLMVFVKVLHQTKDFAQVSWNFVNDRYDMIQYYLFIFVVLQIQNKKLAKFQENSW